MLQLLHQVLENLGCYCFGSKCLEMLKGRVKYESIKNSNENFWGPQNENIYIYKPVKTAFK